MLVNLMKSLYFQKAQEDAWEYLDPIPNCFLGFNRTEECIFKELQGATIGLSAMVRYVKTLLAGIR